MPLWSSADNLMLYLLYLYGRVHEDWPLYDILKQFQKGHSHMAVVVKSKKEPAETDKEAKSRPGFVNIKIDLDSESAQTDRRGSL